MLLPWAALLLFCSGYAALTYQIVWMREFRLVFGASTASTAAVSALFMAGLGIGAWLIGPRTDRVARPLRLYGRLELVIAILAAASPWLLRLTRSLYLSSGGMLVLGFWGATAARLALAAIVVGIPAVLMGGTLPAAVRAVTRRTDSARTGLAWLYGTNTLGAFTGTLLATFFVLEAYGARITLLAAAVLNVVAALGAMAISRRLETGEEASGAEPSAVEAAGEEESGERGGMGKALVLPVAFVVGFAFFLMELVWYRMLSPLLGGSTYTFGLILAVALAGIGLGGALYPVVVRRFPPSPWLLAATCVLEALAMILPFAVGDSLAAVAVQQQPMAAFGFAGIVSVWTGICLFVVFPASLVSGVQFPILIALIGKGSRSVGKQTGWVYASNTLGAIAGSLAGGFGLIPLLSATGCWRVAAGLLLLLSLVLACHALAARQETPGRKGPLSFVAVALITALCLVSAGPSAFWRHSPIGVGRVPLADTQNSLRRAVTGTSVLWQADGVESAVAISGDSGYSFIVNGKVDGNIIGDRGTQVMCGVLAAALHPGPTRAMVVGLGTGCTAGWLAVQEGMEQVDVVELEPAVLYMAEVCAQANHDVVGKARSGEGVRIFINDAREVLNTIPATYDLIVSEPSNPYRAGIASLFTHEFYREVSGRLAPGGIFVNWCQAYEIDTITVFSIAATLRSVFPYVECWFTQSQDLVFVSSNEPIAPDPDQLAHKLELPAFRDAMRVGWSSNGVEAFLAHFVANSDFLAAAAADAEINTDDRMHIEYSYARTVGKMTPFSVKALLQAARRGDMDLPGWAAPLEPAKSHIDAYRILDGVLDIQDMSDPELLNRMILLQRIGTYSGDIPSLSDNAFALPIEYVVYAEALAARGDGRALEYLPHFESWWPVSAELIRARLAWRQGNRNDSVGHLVTALHMLGTHPWEPQEVILRGFYFAENDVVVQYPESVPAMYECFKAPFAMRWLDGVRKGILLRMASLMDPEKIEEVFLTEYEPHVVWDLPFLLGRLENYQARGNPLLGRAVEDFLRFEAADSITVDQYLHRQASEGNPGRSPVR